MYGVTLFMECLSCAQQRFVIGNQCEYNFIIQTWYWVYHDCKCDNGIKYLTYTRFVVQRLRTDNFMFY